MLCVVRRFADEDIGRTGYHYWQEDGSWGPLATARTIETTGDGAVLPGEPVGLFAELKRTGGQREATVRPVHA